MQVKSFECAIARSQIGRYLAGEGLDPDAMEQLEGHIAGCADCRRLIDLRREELLRGPAPETIARSIPEPNPPDFALVAAALAGQKAAASIPAPETTTPLAVSAPVVSAPDPASRQLGDSLAPMIGRLRTAFAAIPMPQIYCPISESSAGSPVATVSVTRKIPALGKAGAYGGALVLTLGAMSYVGDPSSLFGARAETAPVVSKPATPPVKRVAVALGATGVRRSALGIPITDAVPIDAASIDEAPVRPSPTATALSAPLPTAQPTESLSDFALEAFEASLVERDAPMVVTPVVTPTLEVPVSANPIVVKANAPTAVKRRVARRFRPRTKAKLSNPKTVVKKAVAPRPAASSSEPSIRVYDESGQPIK